MQGRMLKRGRGLILATALAALAVPASAPAASFAGPDDRAAASIATSAARPGMTTSLTTSIEWRDPATEGGKPPAVQNVSLVLPAGMAIDTSAPAQCAASDDQLIALGLDACPAESRVGNGSLVTDTGSPDGGPPRYINFDLTAFNGDGQILILADSTGTPSRMVLHATIADGTVSIEFPLLPGAPGPEPLLAYRNFDLTIAPLVVAGKAYVITPPSCSGLWIATFAFTYRDMATQQATAGAPCEVPPPPPPPPSTKKPRVKVSGMPSRKCTKGSFAVKVRIANAGTPRLVAVYFDGRKAGVTQQTTFKLRIHSEGLPRGIHKLKLRVIGENGRKVTITTRFRRC